MLRFESKKPSFAEKGVDGGLVLGEILKIGQFEPIGSVKNDLQVDDYGVREEGRAGGEIWLLLLIDTVGAWSASSAASFGRYYSQ